MATIYHLLLVIILLIDNMILLKLTEIFLEILEEHGKQAHVDAEFIMRELGGEVTQACPPGVSIHAARSVIDSILAEREAKNEKTCSASSSPGRT